MKEIRYTYVISHVLIRHRPVMSCPIAGGENFTNFAIVFLHEILGMLHPSYDQFTFRESFLSEMLPFYRSKENFLPRKLPAISMLQQNPH